MYFKIFLVSIIGLLGMCTNSNTSRYGRFANQTMEYQLEGGQFAVVVVMDGISASEAKRIARQRAAEITVSQGDRYFTIESEQETQVIQSNEMPGNQRFHGNLYQELIIEGDFNRKQDRLNTSTYSAIRLIFTSYKTKPSYRAIDACTLTNCN